MPTVYRYIDQGLLKLRNSALPKKLRRRVKGTSTLMTAFASLVKVDF
ncbi:hypothetical protein [Pediococcus ethanolidurans]|nr:hypothetical protein [Pediococcus ethanolidurans]